jgi:membrane dipeptidase
MNFPVFDLHCDTALALLGNQFTACGKLRENTHHIDLKRASKLPGYAQCFACFTTTATRDPEVTPVQLFEREMATVMREVERNADRIALAYTAQDVEENLKKGLMSAILTIEGPAGFDFDPELLYDLYQVGYRITTLGWNEKNPLTGSNVTGGGLTQLGQEYVKAAQKVGMIIEVKYAEHDDLDAECQKALAQIENLHYADALEEFEPKKIYKYAISCYKKHCRVLVEQALCE